MSEQLSPQELEALILRAQNNYRLAVGYRQSDDFEQARQFLLNAAKALLEASAASRPGLKESRQQLARQLLDEADYLEKTGAQPAAWVQKKAVRTLSNEDEERIQSWLIQEKPSVRFDDIAGLEDVKEQIRLKLLYPFQHPELAKTYGINPGGGILLYGPPGTGKTMIARAVAGEIDAAFFAIKPSEIMSQWVGVAEQNIQKLFEVAESFPVSVVFIDEIEALTPKRRSSNSTVMQRVVPQLLAEMDGFEKRSNVLLMVGATNEPWAIDGALLRPGRLDRMVYVAPPDFNARRRILEMNLSAKPLAEDVSLDELAHNTAGFSGADMAALAIRASERAFFEAIKSDLARHIGRDDFAEVLTHLHSSINPKDLLLFEKFKQGQHL